MSSIEPIVTSSPGRPTAHRRPAPAHVTASLDQTLWERLALVESHVLEDPVDRHLTQYLDTVRDILNQALKRHQAETAVYWSPRGRFRQMVRVVQVNHLLDDLIQDIRLHHPATAIAARLDAIRGLLVDLWA
ncbi:hypothetical protein Sulac_3121 [Sulfobacillus acidophilus DSM 10332]|uniref:DUF327 domain-containing protein n=1 Tax=Sulfobacillus acidophilus (strain ATCC 700253 / DSM 10332 / NAL) TaxID=679936 RepID=G8U122_SULAD|nr:hypothetical protein Sulac_3121 [Sulfobacillus acidophilus DSM 10332]